MSGNVLNHIFKSLPSSFLSARTAHSVSSLIIRVYSYRLYLV